MGKLNGMIALVTGGNSGIGLATAKRFVSEGTYVFVTGRRDAELAAAVREIGRNVTGIKGFASNCVYSATKAAVRSFARTWTSDLKSRRIRVACYDSSYITGAELFVDAGFAQI